MKPKNLLTILPLLSLSACFFLSEATPVPTLPPPHPTVVVITAVGPYYTSFEGDGDWLVGAGPHSTGRVEEGRYLLSVRELSSSLPKCRF